VSSPLFHHFHSPWKAATSTEFEFSIFYAYGEGENQEGSWESGGNHESDREREQGNRKPRDFHSQSGAKW